VSKVAHVRDVRLDVGRAPSGLEFAEVSYTVDFTAAEVDLNLPFTEYIVLWERDEELDSYVQPADPIGITRVGVGRGDDLIGVIYKGDSSIRPNGRRSISRNHRREWRFPENESGREEYRALVQVIPDIRLGGAWSNEVSIDLRGGRIGSED
jgi:hypothetical protein